MSVEENKRVVKEFLDLVISKGDLGAAERLLAPDFQLYFGGMEPVGVEAAKGLIGGFTAAFPDLAITLDELVGEGDTVAARFRWTGTQRAEFMGVPATNRAVVVKGMGFYTVRDGKIVEDRANEDMLGVMQQLGAIPG